MRASAANLANRSERATMDVSAGEASSTGSSVTFTVTLAAFTWPSVQRHIRGNLRSVTRLAISASLASGSGMRRIAEG